MNPTTGSSEPLLAICVPTFNRAASLRNLFLSLGAVKARFGDEIEICISNNGSRDETREVVEAFAREYAVEVQHQKLNIGGTLNIIAVAGQMRARWGIWCGDDDEIDADAISLILTQLRKLAPNTWVLVGRAQYMRHFAQGDFDAAAFRRAVLLSGLDPLGFMGVHVFPRSAVPTLKALRIVDAQPWPHVAALLRHIIRSGTNVRIVPETAIMQANGGVVLFWRAGDLARLHLSKLRLLGRTYAATHCKFLFLHALMLGELYALQKLKLLLLWKLCEHQDFKSNALADFRKHYLELGTLKILAWPHHIFIIFLNQISKRQYKKIFDLFKKTYLRRLYVDKKRKYRIYDGMRRGI
jgi:glycosyltransferase involved in cell wall biosynthesis